jgi:hypothetical protein
MAKGFGISPWAGKFCGVVSPVEASCCFNNFDAAVLPRSRERVLRFFGFYPVAPGHWIETPPNFLFFYVFDCSTYVLCVLIPEELVVLGISDE